MVAGIAAGETKEAALEALREKMPDGELPDYYEVSKQRIHGEEK